MHLLIVLGLQQNKAMLRYCFPLIISSYNSIGKKKTGGWWACTWSTTWSYHGHQEIFIIFAMQLNLLIFPIPHIPNAWIRTEVTTNAMLKHKWNEHQMRELEKPPTHLGSGNTKGSTEEEFTLIVSTDLWVWRGLTSFKSCDIMEVGCDVCMSPVCFQKPRCCHNEINFGYHFFEQNLQLLQTKVYRDWTELGL